MIDLSDSIRLKLILSRLREQLGSLDHARFELRNKASFDDFCELCSIVVDLESVYVRLDELVSHFD